MNQSQAFILKNFNIFLSDKELNKFKKLLEVSSEVHKKAEEYSINNIDNKHIKNGIKPFFRTADFELLDLNVSCYKLFEYYSFFLLNDRFCRVDFLGRVCIPLFFGMLVIESNNFSGYSFALSTEFTFISNSALAFFDLNFINFYNITHSLPDTTLIAKGQVYFRHLYNEGLLSMSDNYRFINFFGLTTKLYKTFKLFNYIQQNTFFFINKFNPISLQQDNSSSLKNIKTFCLNNQDFSINQRFENSNLKLAQLVDLKKEVKSYKNDYMVEIQGVMVEKFPLVCVNNIISFF